MANPISFNPTASQPASRTSGALVLNINAPLSNFAGDGVTATPGGGVNANPNDSFQRLGGGMTNQPAPVFTPNPAASSQDNLVNAYNFANKARSDAENARNQYLALAGQLNNQAYQTQSPLANAFANGPQMGQNFAPPMASGGFPSAPQIAPNLLQAQQVQAQQQQFQQQLQQLQQQQQAQQMQAQQQQLQQQLQAQQQAMMQQQAMQPQPGMDPYAQQQALMQQQAMQPQPGMDPYAQQQALMQQQAMQPQPGMDPYAQQQAMMQQQAMQPQPGQSPLAGATITDLNNMLAQPQSPQEKLNAITEIGMRGQGDQQTYELLKQEIQNGTPGLPPSDATMLRQQALMTLGYLNGYQNNQVGPNGEPPPKTIELPGLDAISQIINNRNEDPALKTAAITALAAMNRPQDALIRRILGRAAKDANPEVKARANETMNGAAAMQQQAAGMDPNMLAQMQAAQQPGMDPNMLAQMQAAQQQGMDPNMLAQMQAMQGMQPGMAPQPAY